MVEWGGGNGRMALQLLDEMKRTAPDVYVRLTYTLIESSLTIASLQKELLEEHEEAYSILR